MITLEVLSTGPLTLVEDLGRTGLAHLGVTGSGPADRRSHDLANRLVANPPDRAALEVTLGGLSVQVQGGSIDIAVTGADCTPAIGGIPFGLNSVRRVKPGQIITLTMPSTGVRSYLAVRGGIDVVPVLGSRSRDTLSGIGPPPLRVGDRLPIGTAGGDFPSVEQAPIAALTGGAVSLTVIRGPRDDWFTNPDALTRHHWTVSDHTDRIGVRLIGQPLEQRWPGRELPSEAMLRGAIQVPPSGQPVILGADHPVTGGYPVVGVLVDADTDAAAQLRPGQSVRFGWAGR